MRISHRKVSVSLLAVMGFGVSAMAATPAASTANVAAGSAHHAAAIPAALRPALYQAMARDAGPAYAIGKDGCATLPKEKLTACFTDSGAHFTPPAGQAEGAASPLALHLVAWGRPSAAEGKGGKLTAVKPVKPTIKGNQASYAHGDLAEWWRVLPMGFEQGFTIAERPAGHGQLMLALATSRQDAGAPSIHHSRLLVRDTQTDERGNPVENTLAWGKLRYGQLVVTDAKGNVIPATLKSADNRILIAVNDTHATYPITVDPLVWIEQKVTANDGVAQDGFGYAVSLDNATALIGAPNATVDDNIYQGAVYVFSESNGTWNEVQKLTANDGTMLSSFGSSVAVNDGTALIGTPGATVLGRPDQGAVYVFTESGGIWNQTQKLTASDGTEYDNFGSSLALDGTATLIGAPGADIGSNNDQGAAYVFANSNGAWNETQKLTAGDGTTNDYFGSSVSLDNTTALVGAPLATVNGNVYQGVAYVFNKSNSVWSETQKLMANDGSKNDWFSFSIALAGNTALIGAPNAVVSGDSNTGAVYVFKELSGIWSQTQELTANDSAMAGSFGTSVALSRTTALVGTPAAYVRGNGGQGAVYVYTKSGGAWSQIQKLTAIDGSAGDGAGATVALAGNIGLAGAPSADVRGNSMQGAAYFYSQSNLDLAVSSSEVDPIGWTVHSDS